MGINYNFVMCGLTANEDGNSYTSSCTPREMISAVLAGMMCFLTEKQLEYGESWDFDFLTFNAPYFFYGASEKDGVVTVACMEMTTQDRYLLTFKNGVDSNICTLSKAS